MRPERQVHRHPARSSLLWENVRMALGSLLSTKLRSILTLLGLMIGVGTVIAMMALIEGLNSSMKKQIASMGSGILYVTKYEAGIQFGYEHRKPRKDLKVSDAEAIAEFCPSVSAVSPEVGDACYISAAGIKTSMVSMMGVTRSFCETNNWDPEEGRFFTADDLKHRSRVAVLGRGPAGVLFPHGGVLGQWIEVEGMKYQVIGMLASKGSFLGRSQDDVVLLPLPVVARLRQYGESVDYIVVRPQSPRQTETARDEITELLRRRRGVRADQPDDFGITTQEALMGLYKRLTGVFYLVTILLSSIGLMVGGIGVMNMMLVSVKERTREIGVRAALGARRRDILGQFLTEAVTLTLVGGLLGIGLGFALAGGIHIAAHLPWAVTIPGIVLALSISAGVGIFFGWYPAFRASRLDPVEALRYE
jgi:putative ABC transport system permease protein